MKELEEALKVFIGVLVGSGSLDDGKVVEMYVPRETNLLSKASPSHEELSPLVISLDPRPTFLHHHLYSIALKSLLDLLSTRSHTALITQPSHTGLHSLRWSLLRV